MTITVIDTVAPTLTDLPEGHYHFLRGMAQFRDVSTLGTGHL